MANLGQIAFNRKKSAVKFENYIFPRKRLISDNERSFWEKAALLSFVFASTYQLIIGFCRLEF